MNAGAIFLERCMEDSYTQAEREILREEFDMEREKGKLKGLKKETTHFTNGHHGKASYVFTSVGIPLELNSAKQHAYRLDNTIKLLEYYLNTEKERHEGRLLSSRDAIMFENFKKGIKHASHQV